MPSQLQTKQRLPPTLILPPGPWRRGVRLTPVPSPRQYDAAVLVLQIPKWCDRMSSDVTERMAVGVVAERRAIDHPWRKWRWRAVEVVPGLPGGPG